MPQNKETARQMQVGYMEGNAHVKQKTVDDINVKEKESL